MGRPDYIFGQFWETARCRDAQHGDGVCCAFAPQLVKWVNFLKLRSVPRRVDGIRRETCVPLGLLFGGGEVGVGVFSKHNNHNRYTPCPGKKSLQCFRHNFVNTGRFSKFFHFQNLLEICNKAIVKYPTSPQTRHYTTLWNIDVRKLAFPVRCGSLSES